MAERTAISWTDATVNFWWGCTKVGPGCDLCYAETWAKRTGHRVWGAGAPRRLIASAAGLLHRLDNGYADWAADFEVRTGNARAFGLPVPTIGRRRRVFIQSMSDLFDLEVPAEWFAEAWQTIERCDRLEIQILTKRLPAVEKRLAGLGRVTWPKHAGLMVTVVNQAEADRDIPRLLALKAKLGIPWVGLSMEPLLGPVDLTSINPQFYAAKANALTGIWQWELGPATTETPRLDWVIVGGESGKNARPMHPEWARAIRDACAAAGVPFHFKQWGQWAVGADLAEGSILLESDGLRRTATMGWIALSTEERERSGLRQPVMMRPLGKDKSGRELDGATHDGFPEVGHG